MGRKNAAMKFLVFIALACLLPTGASAASAEQLLAMINAYRADPPACEGKKSPPLPPLAPEAPLAELRIAGPGQLPQAMQAAGYRAARAEAISLSGPASAQEAFRFAVANSCRLLLNPDYSVIGISQQGREWQLVFARPLLAQDLGDWQSAGKQVLEQVNRAREKSRQCGDKLFHAAPPLRWNDKLAQAARKHSADMASKSYFAHEGRDGSTLADRVQAEQYRWRRIGENIAAGHGSAGMTVQGWLASPGHCANIMDGSFTEMGAAYVYDADSETGIYWTQVFGRPR